MRAVGPYEGVLREIIHALKFDQRRSVAARLGTMIRESAEAILADADALIPVPLHPWRQWRRGFNQATLLASTLDLPVWHALWRRRATSPQAELDAAARRDNVAGAFALAGLTPRSRARWRSRVDGKLVVLVDDVQTTGATLEACARVLVAARAREVRAVTAARVVLA